MTKNTFRIVAVSAAFALVALVGLMGLNAVAGSGDDRRADGLFPHLHSMARGLHHGHHGGHHQEHAHHQHMARLIEQMDLTAGQQQHLEKIHEVLASRAGDAHTSMAEIHHQMITRVAQGELDADGVRALIDGHLEEMRSVAYAVTDELVALIDGLDSGQREILLQHLQGNHAGHQGP